MSPGAVPLTSPMTLYSCAVLVAFAALIPLGFPASADDSTFVWPLPEEFSSGNVALSVNPGLSLVAEVDGGGSSIVKGAFDRYSRIVFQHNDAFSIFNAFGRRGTKASGFDINKLRVIVHSKDETLQLGVDESYILSVPTNAGKSIAGEAIIEANTVYGALRGLETFSQLCAFDFGTKTVLVNKAPWYIKDKPRFAYRGLLLDTSRHYQPMEVIKHIIDSMSYAKLNVLHWHIIDEQSFPLEVPTYPKLWQGAYSRWERYTVEDAYDIVNYAKSRGIHVMAEVDVPGHAESWGKGYPQLWPSSSCREPLDVSNNFTFDLISGMLSDMRKIFPFELFHLGGDEVNTDCWTFTPHVQKWLQSRNMTGKDAYTSFVLKAQQIAISKGWTPVNWEETFNNFPKKLDRRTVVHNWLGPGVCPKVVNSGLRCIFSNQGVWYLDHLDVPWDKVYTAEPLEGITDPSKQKLVLGGEVCMWGETADPSNVLPTIWPRAAAAAERLWSKREAMPTANLNKTVLPRLHYFRCLLNTRGVQAAPVTNKIGRSQPNGPGSCYVQ